MIFSFIGGGTCKLLLELRVWTRYLIGYTVLITSSYDYVVCAYDDGYNHDSDEFYSDALNHIYN